MWLVTRIGFFSIVEKPGDSKDGVLTIRARVRADLEELGREFLPSLGPIKAHAGTDYAYRAKAPKADVEKAVALLIQDIGYSNFKSAVASRQGNARAAIYHDVWSVLSTLEEAQTHEAKPIDAISAPCADAYGGVLVDQAGRVLLRKPTGHFGGYHWTFAKGRPDKGEPPAICAAREVLEETGYRVKIVGVLPSAYPGSTTSTAFFLMTPEGEPGPYDRKETSDTRWVSFDEARELVAMNQGVGKKRDRIVLDDAEAAFRTLRT